MEKLGRARGESLTEWSGNASFDMMAALAEGPSGRNVGWAERGVLGVITDEATLAWVAKRYAPGGPMHGKGSELVIGERLRELEPALSPALLGATWHPKGATVDPFLVCDAYAARARAAGAHFALGQRVTALARRPSSSGGGFTAVVEQADTLAAPGAPRAPVALDCDELVIATGWLCRPLAAQLGYDVRVSGTHGQLFTTQARGGGRGGMRGGVLVGCMKSWSRCQMTDRELRITVTSHHLPPCCSRPPWAACATASTRGRAPRTGTHTPEPSPRLSSRSRRTSA